MKFNCYVSYTYLIGNVHTLAIYYIGSKFQLWSDITIEVSLGGFRWFGFTFDLLLTLRVKFGNSSLGFFQILIFL